MPRTLSGRQLPSLRTVPYEISDSTARKKADRVMKELYLVSSREHWDKTNKLLGYDESASPTRQWQALLQLSRKRDDVEALCVDRKGEPMRRPDPKRTDRVMFWLLAVGPDSERQEDSLCLSVLQYERRTVLSPSKRTQANYKSVTPLLRVSLHVLQRLIQRGYGLTESGEISHQLLRQTLVYVWGLADDCLIETEQKSTRPESIKVSFGGVTFVITTRKETDTMDLVTMYDAGGKSDGVEPSFGVH